MEAGVRSTRSRPAQSLCAHRHIGGIGGLAGRGRPSEPPDHPGPTCIAASRSLTLGLLACCEAALDSDRLAHDPATRGGVPQSGSCHSSWPTRCGRTSWAAARRSLQCVHVGDPHVDHRSASQDRPRLHCRLTDSQQGATVFCAAGLSLRSRRPGRRRTPRRQRALRGAGTMALTECRDRRCGARGTDHQGDDADAGGQPRWRGTRCRGGSDHREDLDVAEEPLLGLRDPGWSEDL